MAFRYPVPDEEQAKRLRANAMDPKAYFVIRADEDGTMLLQNYKTGDEIRITPNAIKRRF